MNFFEYYRNISGLQNKRNFRKKIMEKAQIEHSTFYTWLQRKKIPALEQSVISELLNIPVTELFPKPTEETKTV